MYEAVLFDMDGVIIDTERSVTVFWRHLGDRHQVTLSDEDLRRHVYGRPADATLDALFPHLTVAERRAVHAAMREYETHETYREIPGAIDFLRGLTRHAVPTALVTSGEPWKVGAVMEQLGISDLFATQVTASDIMDGKPHPQCYLLAARALAVPAQRCLVFEDAVSGVEAAVAAGAVCVGVAPPDRERVLRAAGASHIIPDFTSVACCAGTRPRKWHGAAAGSRSTRMIAPAWSVRCISRKRRPCRSHGRQ